MAPARKRKRESAKEDTDASECEVLDRGRRDMRDEIYLDCWYALAAGSRGDASTTDAMVAAQETTPAVMSSPGPCEAAEATAPKESGDAHIVAAGAEASEVQIHPAGDAEASPRQHES